MKKTIELSVEDTSRIIEMAWEDRTPFEMIEQEFGLTESHTIRFMRAHLTDRSFKVWRIRVSGRVTKHAKLRNPNVNRAYCPTQYKRA